jgi:hypothetical protein
MRDALQLATMQFLRQLGQKITVASSDLRSLAAAGALGIEPVPL